MGKIPKLRKKTPKGTAGTPKPAGPKVSSVPTVPAQIPQALAPKKEPAKIGRPTKLNDELQQAILDNIVAGCVIEVAVRSVGISETTFYRWLKEADDTPEGSPLRQFRDAVERAKDECESRSLSIIANAAVTNWTAAAWLLERRHPERWARRDNLRLFPPPGSEALRIIVEYPKDWRAPTAIIETTTTGELPPATEPAPELEPA